MKRRTVICTSAMLALALAGCTNGTGSTAGHMEYIGLDAAKAVALEVAGIQEGEATFSTTGLDQRNGIHYYAVDFTANGQNYTYDIDAVTGVVIDSSVTGDNQQTLSTDDQTTASAAPAPTPTPVGTAQGTTAVADPLPVVSQATPTPGGNSQTTAQQSAGITADQAKQAALSHAGLSGSQVTFVKAKLDWDDGRRVYEVEFYDTSYKEYDYEIDASTGAVVKFDYDAEYAIPQTSGGQSITADQAKQKALSQVPGATVKDIYQFETDYDDGRLQYEGEILYNGMKYEFQIDGHSGSIQEWEAEPFGS